MPKFSVRKPLTVFVAVLAVIILGVVAFTRMTPDLFPNMDFPYVMIMTTYPGQSPEIVEEEITRPLEQSMATLEHIKSVTSNSAENFSMVVLEFENDVNMDTIGVDIQQNISALSGTWDESVGSPYVLKINPSVIPIAIAATSVEGMDITELSDFLDETIIPKLESVTGIASVSATGSIYRQVHVVISQEKIDRVNGRLRDAVTGQLDDAQAELEEAKAELEEAQAELKNAQEQLESGRDMLVSQSGSAQAMLSAQQMAVMEGRMEIQRQLLQLQTTKTTLAAAVSTLTQLQSGIDQLLAARAELEAELAELDRQAAERDDGQAEIEDLEDQIAQLEEEIAGLEDLITSLLEQIAGLMPDEGEGDDEQAPQETEQPDADPALPDVDMAEQLAQLQEAFSKAQADMAAAQTALTQLRAQLAGAEADQSAWEALLSTAEIDRLRIQAELEALNASLAAIDAQLESMGTDREGLQDQIEQMQANIAAVDAGTEQLNTALTQLDSGAIQLSEAMGVLSSSQSSGLLELADAATQLTVNSAAVDSAMEQVESGLETLEESRADALDQADLSGSITMNTVSSILAAQNFSMPAGYVEENGARYMVSVGDEITNQNELEALLLFDTGEDAIGPVYLGDVADIFVTDNADSVYAKLNGADSIMLSFDKQSNAATAEVSDNLTARFEQLKAQYPGLEFVFLMDQGDYIYLIVNSIMESLLTGAAFAIIILFLFLRDLRPTVITLVAIPVSVVFAFVLMYFSGVTLNMISLSGLAVAVGMLVDNSIVVIENIYRLRAKGATALQAAVAGAQQVAGAITSSTLTTVCVFLPIVFVQGMTRQIFTDLALTMTYSLMASLVVALTLVPAMARGMLKEPKQGRREKRGRRVRRNRYASDSEGPFYRGYRAIAAWSLRHKFIVLAMAVLLLGFSAWTGLRKGFSYMPEMDMNTVSVTITMPENIQREDAVALADAALERIQTLEDVEYVGAMMSGGSLLGSGDSYDVTVYVGLPEGYSGDAAGHQITRLCADMDCDVSYDSAMMDMSLLTGSGVTVNVYGGDMEDLQKAARSVAAALENVQGVDEVDDGLEDTEQAYHLWINKNAAMEKGFTVAQIYMELATALTRSATAMDMDMAGVSADVIVQADSGMTADELMAYTFESTDASGEIQSFTLDEVAELRSTVSLSSINRIDQRRYLSVSGSIADGYNVTRVTAVAQDAVAKAALPDDVTYEFSGENETIMEAVSDLGLMLLMGLALVYFVMVAQFQSLKSPFIVMFTIPLAFTGGFLALLIFGMDVSIVSLIGFVMLMGIIVNNGIVLVDYINQLRADGMERREAIIEAGVTRMRPVFMTSLTTILGLIVMAIGRDVGTSLMQPVAVVCIGGLLYATLMTLFVVPCIYDIMNRKDVVAISDSDMEFDED